MTHRWASSSFGIATLPLLAAMFAFGCGTSGGPKQAEGPKPDLGDHDGPGASNGAAADGTSSPELAAANDALAAKDFATARKKAQAVLDKTPKNGEALFILGNCDDADEKLDDAVVHYQGALAADPKLTGASVNLSADLYFLKRYDEAAEVAKAGLQYSKETVELHLNLGYALSGKGDHATAAKSFANALKLKPKDPSIEIMHGNELVEAGDKAGAQAEFKNAVANAGGDLGVMRDAAIGFSHCDDPTGCVAALDQALPKSPDDKTSADILADRAICKHKGGDDAGWKKDLGDAIGKDSTSIKAHLALAEFSEKAKDKKTCKSEYAAVLKLQTSGPVADAAKKGLERCK